MSNPSIPTLTSYFHPEDPAGWLKPGDAFMVDGLDWSWAFVWYKEVVGIPAYRVGSNGTLWSCLKLVHPKGCRGSRSIVTDEWLPIRTVVGNRHLIASVSGSGKHRAKKIHILVLEAFIGPRPPGMLGLHWDDNPSNNRLSNLRWGSHLDNAADADRNERQLKGEKHQLSKLSDADVVEMRLAYAAGGVSRSELARRYGISDPSAQGIIAGDRWAHAAGPIAPTQPPKLDQAKADEIRELASRGTSRREISRRFSVSYSMVGLVVRGGAWNQIRTADAKNATPPHD